MRLEHLKETSRHNYISSVLNQSLKKTLKKSPAKTSHVNFIPTVRKNDVAIMVFWIRMSMSLTMLQLPNASDILPAKLLF